MKTNNLLYTLLFFSLVHLSFAQRVSQREAKVVVNHFWLERSLLEASLSLVEENNAFFVFGDENSFLLLSKDARVYPVLAYSDETSWEGSKENPHFDWLVDSYQKEIEYIQNTDYQAPQHIQELWARYLNPSYFPQKNNNVVTPMLQATWSQGCYYNSAFPEESEGPCEHPYTGCVATAMGQVMHYFQYPAQGIGSHTYNSYYGELTADYGETNYQWSSMTNHLTEENEAVSQLLLHCAIGVNMVFLANGQGSGAYDHDIPDALIHFFDYDTTARYLERSSYVGDWNWTIRNELEMGRPLIYGAVAGEGSVGHTFVCDGFQDTTHFHINWGWDGYGNGYFLLDSLTLSDYHFDQYHDAIIGINPQANGIEEVLDEAFSIYIKGKEIYISCSSTVEACQLYDLQGIRLIDDTNINTSEYHFTSSNLSGSIYVLRLRIEGVWYSQKLYL